MFYVYKWYNIETNEVFYIGKGTGKRYKDIKQRNQIFLEYLNNNKCDSKIIKTFESEEEAFAFEKEMIKKYCEKNQAIANLDDGGKGGCNFVWTQQMREYQSKYNPMKKPEQRKRMSENNPMKNPEIAAKNGAKRKRAVIINGQEFCGVIDAAKYFGVKDNTITTWCKRGYNSQGQPCRYKDEEQKEYPKIKEFYTSGSTRCVIIDNEHFFYSVKDAALFCGATDSSPLVRALKAGKPYKGHLCRYADQQPS